MEFTKREEYMTFESILFWIIGSLIRFECVGSMSLFTYTFVIFTCVRFIAREYVKYNNWKLQQYIWYKLYKIFCSKPAKCIFTESFCNYEKYVTTWTEFSEPAWTATHSKWWIRTWSFRTPTKGFLLPPYMHASSYELCISLLTDFMQIVQMLLKAQHSEHE